MGFFYNVIPHFLNLFLSICRVALPPEITLIEISGSHVIKSH